MPNETFFRLAHISDLHFSKISWNPLQFFSKRWLGNLNLLLARQYAFAPDHLTTLIPLFHERKIDAVLITGDLTSTSQEAEFEMAQEFIEMLKQEHFKVFVLPGNHDQYTKSACKKQSFYQFFPAQYGPPTDPLSSLSLKDDGITAAYFGHGWWLIALDTAIATSLVSSNGYFSEKVEQKLEKALKDLPSGHQAILINHFPIFSNESSRKSLLRKEALKKIMEKFPQIKLFLHGHTHRHTIADLRASALPIMLDSGSAAQKAGGTWNQIDITSAGCTVEVFKNTWENGSFLWNNFQTVQFKW